MWEVGNDTANKFRIRDLAYNAGAGMNALEIPSASFNMSIRKRLDLYGEAVSGTSGGGIALWALGDLDPSKTGPRTKIFAIAQGFAPGTMNNGTRGDQLGNDNTIAGGATTIMSLITGLVDGESSSTEFNERGAMDVMKSRVVSAEVDPTTAITASPSGITNSGGLIKVTSTNHGCVTNDRVTLAGATPSGVNGPWAVTVIDANNFTLQGSTFVSTGGGGTVQRHIYGDISASTFSVEAERPGGGVQGGEWSITSNAGKWAKTHGLTATVNEHNTYASWTDANAAGDNPIWNANSSYRNRASAGISVVAAGTGQAGTLIHLCNGYGNLTPAKRWMTITRDTGFNVVGTDVYVIEGGDATGVRVGIGAAAAVNQTTNPSGLPARLVIAAASSPTTFAEGMQFGMTNPASLYRRADNHLGTSSSFSVAATNVTLTTGGPPVDNFNGMFFQLAAGNSLMELHRTNTTDPVLRLWKTAPTRDTVPHFQLETDGRMSWGNGAAARDTFLYRSAANVLKTDDSFHVLLDLSHLGSNLGFYGTAPAAKPTVTGSKTVGPAALASLLTALAGLGLITDSSSA